MANTRNSNGSKKNSSRPGSIDDALEVLDQASATNAASSVGATVSEHADNLQTAVGEKMSMASDRLDSMKENFGRQFHSLSDNLKDFGADFGGDAAETISRLADQGMQAGQEVYRQVDRQLRANPWPIIGGIAVGTFALGFLFGRSTPPMSDERQV